MTTDKGVIEGDAIVAAVDANYQIIATAQAPGTGAEQEQLLPVVEAFATMHPRATVFTVDAIYRSDANLAALTALAVPALMVDPTNGSATKHSQTARTM